MPPPYKVVCSGTGLPDSAKKHPVTKKPWQEPDRLEDEGGVMIAHVNFYYDRMPGVDFDVWLREKNHIARSLAMVPVFKDLLVRFLSSFDPENGRIPTPGFKDDVIAAMAMLDKPCGLTGNE